MSEQAGNNPENQPATQEQSLAVRGLLNVVDGWRRWRIERLEDGIAGLDTGIDMLDGIMEVNQNTGQYGRIARGPGTVKEPTLHTNPADLPETRRNWVIKTAHESPTGEVAADGTVAESLRPVYPVEQNTKRRVETAKARTVRSSRLVGNLHRTYDIPDEAEKERLDRIAPIPDRRPQRGNRAARAVVDEGLRRAGHLADQPARGPEPKIRLGTQEHQDAMDARRLQVGRPKRRSEVRGVARANRVLEKQGQAVDNRVGYVERVAQGTDRTGRRITKEIDRMERKIDKKQRKIATHRAKIR